MRHPRTLGQFQKVYQIPTWSISYEEERQNKVGEIFKLKLSGFRTELKTQIKAKQKNLPRHITVKLQ